MWGSWFMLIAGGLVVLAVLLAFAVGASPLFAVLASIVAVVILGGIALARRGTEYAEGEPVSGEALRGRNASGAPAAGEGGPPPVGQ